MIDAGPQLLGDVVGRLLDRLVASRRNPPALTIVRGRFKTGTSFVAIPFNAPCHIAGECVLGDDPEDIRAIAESVRTDAALHRRS